jgi:hypothetical protein
MKIIVNESRLNQLIENYIKKKFKVFIPPHGRGHPEFMGSFNESIEDDPIAFIRRYHGYEDILFVTDQFVKEIENMFGIDFVILKKIFIESSIEIISETQPSKFVKILNISNVRRY